MDRSWSSVIPKDLQLNMPTPLYLSKMLFTDVQLLLYSKKKTTTTTVSHTALSSHYSSGQPAPPSQTDRHVYLSHSSELTLLQWPTSSTQPNRHVYLNLKLPHLILSRAAAGRKLSSATSTMSGSAVQRRMPRVNLTVPTSPRRDDVTGGTCLRTFFL